MENLISKVDDLQEHILTISPRSGSLGNVDEQPSLKESLTDIHERVSSLEDQMTRTYDALDWVISALADNNMTPKTVKRPTRYNSVTPDGIQRVHGPSYKKASSKKRLKRQSTIIDTNCMVHVKARSSPYPGTDIPRFDVGTENVPWDSTLSGYTPPRYTSNEVLEPTDWSDKEIFKKDEYTWNKYDDITGIDRSSHLGIYKIANGYPRNPSGRTGLTGRGSLGRWGPNHAADAIITRWKHDVKGEAETRDDSPVLEFVAVKRQDNRQWSLPGVFMLAREDFSTTVQRAFVDEALGNLMENVDLATTMEPKLRRIFQNGQEVYTGYVDDARNTDNAWVETKAVNYHDKDGSVTKGITLMAGSRQDAAAWLTVWSKMPMHSNHLFILEKVANLHGAAF